MAKNQKPWYLRGNIVHGSGKEQISGSVAFLIKYEQEVRLANDKVEAMESTGCQNLYGDQRAQPPVASEVQWTLPPLGVAKLNTAWLLKFPPE